MVGASSEHDKRLSMDSTPAISIVAMMGHRWYFPSPGIAPFRSKHRKKLKFNYSVTNFKKQKRRLGRGGKTHRSEFLFLLISTSGVRRAGPPVRGDSRGARRRKCDFCTARGYPSDGISGIGAKRCPTFGDRSGIREAAR